MSLSCTLAPLKGGQWFQTGGGYSKIAEEGCMLSGARRQVLLASVLCFMLMAAIPLSATGEEGDDLEIMISIDEPSSAAPFHADTEALSVTISVKNNAANSRQVIYNPSCPFNLDIESGDWSFDIDDDRTCRTQQRAIDVAAGQSRILSTWSWDWLDAADELSPSGHLTLNFEQPEMGLTNSAELTFHRNTPRPDGLDLRLTLAQNPAGLAHSTGIGAHIYASLANTASSTVEVPFDAACSLYITATSADKSYTSITEVSCGQMILDAGQSTTLGWLDWDFSDDDGVEFSEGEIELSVAMTGIEESTETLSIDYFHSNPTAMSEISGPSSPLIAHTALSEYQAVWGSNEVVTWQFSVENSGEKVRILEFADDCVVDFHVVSQNGAVVSDSRGDVECNQYSPEQKVDAGENFTLLTDVWDFTDEAGCEVADGNYRLIASQPDHQIWDAVDLYYDGGDSGYACLAALQSTSSIWFNVEEFTVEDRRTADERVTFGVEITNGGITPFALYWPTDCQLNLELSHNNAESVDVHHSWVEGCGEEVGSIDILMPGESLRWGTFTVPFVVDGVPLANGSWLLTTRTTSVPGFTTYAAHSFNGVKEVSIEEPIEPAIPEEEVPVDEAELNPAFEVEGSWHYVTLSERGCWLLVDAENDERAFVINTEDHQWNPHPQLEGRYLVEATQTEGDCVLWNGISILDIIDEWEREPVVAPVPNHLPSPPSTADIVVENAPAALAVVASTSLAAAALMFIGNTEWLRIPAMQAAIGLVGMVRRNGEHDGEFQRGRIMGFLTANPGVHFRALLGALEMSNGQLTHHLKVLNTDERVWRRKDGRLVRFYPSTIQEGTDEQDLPVPLLTPDPNSLQGKILGLLDATENDIINLSQKELADRLTASQQLISHHLRTLQKFGLIEREKVGLRYRYQLTREAIFLVNSNEFLGNED